MPPDRNQMGLKYFLFVALFITACAQVQPLEGGNKDDQAPIPNFEQASPSFASTEVRPSQIRIPFNEYIKLSNPNSNISVTPELNTKPKFEVRGKDLLISLNSADLMDNTTYSFVFNKAVADVNEGNDTTFTYVFSTGKLIDSLSYNLVLIDAESQTPVSNATVGLYVPSDSLNPYKHRAKYVAPTNKEGQAQFQYLSEQELEVFAYFNKDGGKILNSSSIAFLSEKIKIDTISRLDTLYLFQPKVVEERGRILKKELTLSGRIEFVTNFEQKTDEITLTSEGLPVQFLVEKTPRQDSTILWLQAQENSSYLLTVPFRDTVLSTRIPTRKFSEFKLKYADNLSSGDLEIKDSLTLMFNLPIASFDTTKMVVYKQDSIPLAGAFSIKNHRSLVLAPAESQNRIYIAPEAITFYDGSIFKDTIDLKFNRKTEKKYANLELKLENKPDFPLVLRLYQGKDVAVDRAFPATYSTMHFELLPPGEYTLQVILDLNANGQFDTGDYTQRIQPEPVIWFRQPITLRANWDTSQPVEFK